MEGDFLNEPDVKTFVRQIKDGSYDIRNKNGELELPNFTHYHISELLEFVEDMSEISIYPLSAAGTMPKHPRLGVCLLWTVEGIRVGKKFPTFNCLLTIKTEEGVREATDDEAKEVANLYRLWWKPLLPYRLGQDKYLINPLEETPYHWY